MWTTLIVYLSHVSRQTLSLLCITKQNTSEHPNITAVCHIQPHQQSYNVTSVRVYNTRASCKLTTSIMTACFFFLYNIHQQFFYIKVQKCVFLVNIKLKLKNGNMPKSIQIATYNNTRIHKIFIKGKANSISFTSTTFKLTCNIFSFFFLAYTHSKNKSNH